MLMLHMHQHTANKTGMCFVIIMYVCNNTHDEQKKPDRRSVP